MLPDIKTLRVYFLETVDEYVKSEIEKYLYKEVCPKCHEARLKDDAKVICACGESFTTASTYMGLRQEIRSFLLIHLP